MNKQELKQKINELPLFETRAVKVQAPKEGPFVNAPHYSAICEMAGDKPYAFVTKGYQLVQFKEVFTPIINSVEEDLNGDVVTYGGFARMTIFPDIEQLKDGDNHFGLIAMNSVDMSSSVIIKFCVMRNDYRVYLPAKIAGFKKSHTSQVINVAKDYISMVGRVKQIWGNIVTEFPKFKIVLDKTSKDHELELSEMNKQLGFGKRMLKFIKEKIEKYEAGGKSFTLWDLFETAITKAAEAKYKSEIHEAKNIDGLCDSIFDYATVLGI